MYNYKPNAIQYEILDPSDDVICILTAENLSDGINAWSIEWENKIVAPDELRWVADFIDGLESKK